MRTSTIMVAVVCVAAAIAIFAGNPTSAVAQAWGPVASAAGFEGPVTPAASVSPESAGQTAAPDRPAPPPARPSDVESMDSIMHAVYDVISGGAGQKRDWDRMRSLFGPGAHLIAVGSDKKGGYVVRMVDIDGYINRAAPYFEKEGFFEKESARRTEAYGQIAQVFSTYESRHTASDAEPFERGINSFQLMN
ncbi:MAG TPA: hypothetical protein VI756_17795, partial [Blastocatellia bacterium]